MPFRLYATIPEGKQEAISALIRAEWPKAILTSVPNRGRDIAPFLHQARLAEEDGVDVICKVHTKKSGHRLDGDEWRRDLYDKLLGDAYHPATVAAAFAANAALGIIAPKGHTIAADYFWGANAARVHELAERLGYGAPMEPFMFPAGSMFWIRSRALKPVIELAFKTDDFEHEAGQVDGTLAHALERLFPIAAKMRGFRLADTRVLESAPRVLDHLRSENELAHLKERSRSYRFAPAVGHPKHDRVHVFTSAAFNYIPKARLLFEALRKHHPEWVLHLALGDEPHPEFKLHRRAVRRPHADRGARHPWLARLGVLSLDRGAVHCH